METLIELYDERAIENVIGPDTFKPKKVIYLCPEEIAHDEKIMEDLKYFFQKRKTNVDIELIKSNLYNADKILRQLEYIFENYKDCCLDITGGNDATLFAAGMFCERTKVPAFTYSRKKNLFFNIKNAEFADKLKCELEYSVEDFFLMTGGRIRAGRVDNKALGKYMDKFDQFFSIFLKYRRDWIDAVTFFTRISQCPKEEIRLFAEGSLEQKGEHGRRVHGNRQLLKELEELGFILNLSFDEENNVSFIFRDEIVRNWLRDVGSVLELFMYKECVKTGIFTDVTSSAVVDWDGLRGHETVTNEIDVVASRGVIPIFISCKACDIKTEALNELAILRDRFGGKGAKAAIASTEKCTAAARHRAAQLGITVIDLEELKTMDVTERLKIIMKVKV